MSFRAVPALTLLIVGGLIQLLAVLGLVVVHTTARSLLIREHGDWRSALDEAQASEQP